MTPAELKTTREALCLPVTWLAEKARVQERTVRYWESGRNVVPDDVAELIDNLEKRAEYVVAQVCETVAASDLPVSSVAMLRYKDDADLWKYRPDLRGLPATYHGAILARIKRTLEADGVECRIVYMDPDEYGAWLKDQGKKDSEQMRAIWAGTRDR